MDSKTTNTTRWMHTVSIVMTNGHARRNSNTTILCSDFMKTVLWCGSCCEQIGLSRVTRVSAPKPDAPPPPTIEDMLRDIIREEIREPRY
jgi:hypothetical protein